MNDTGLPPCSKNLKERKPNLQYRDNLSQQLQHSDNPTIVLPTGSVTNFTDIALKSDHDRRPFWVTPSGRIILEGTY